MRIDSYTIVHYGKDYLSYALQSVYDIVTQAHVIWTPNPSHGHSTNIPPPETREEIRQAAFAYDPDKKVRWYELHNTFQEGPQRDKAVKVCQDSGADIVLVVDYDEIWHKSVLENCVAYVVDQNDNPAFGSNRNWLINFTHLWRSFDWCCRDQGWPVRFIDLRFPDGTGYVPKELGEIYHFGYAVRDEIMFYKIQIHGHKNEFRVNWLEDKWLGWTSKIKDVHPTNDKEFWMPEPFDRRLLPGLMFRHPFYNLERID